MKIQCSYPGREGSEQVVQGNRFVIWTRYPTYLKKIDPLKTTDTVNIYAELTDPQKLGLHLLICSLGKFVIFYVTDFVGHNFSIKEEKYENI
jgi:hypothetical protein